MKKLKFTSDEFKNFHLNIVDNGIEVVVSINIEPGIIPYLQHSDIRVFRKNKFMVYVLKSIITEINPVSVNNCYNFLLIKAMIDCREAKQKLLQSQIENIKKGL